MKSYWNALLIWALCLHRDHHDTFPRRAGDCHRCGLPTDKNGRTQR